MSDILERLRLRQSRIVDGTMHTCGDTCTHPDCLAVASLREIERLRGLLREALDTGGLANDLVRDRIDAALTGAADQPDVARDEYVEVGIQYKFPAIFGAWTGRESLTRSSGSKASGSRTDSLVRRLVGVL